MLYTTVPFVKAQLGITDTDNDDLIALAIGAASREIDRWTGTTFYPVFEARTFMAPADGVLWVDRFTDPTGLIVATGTGGTYTTVVAAGQYVLWPLNAASRGLAYDRISFAVRPVPGAWAYPTVQITANWGYATTPADVEAAARIMAAALFRRKDSPEGETGAMDAAGADLHLGTVRLGPATLTGHDHDVTRLLAHYIEFGIA